MKVKEPLICTEYGEVTVTDPALRNKLYIIGEFYLSIPTDDVFYEMRKKAGIDTRGGKSLVYGQSWFEEGGIVIGQWLQAFCRYYLHTGDARYYARAQEYVHALAQVHKVVPSCYICETAYMSEKVFHGLMDAYELCHIPEAYDLCKALIDNFRQIPQIANAACRLGDNGTQDETFREIEWYTLSEALYRFTDMAIAHSEPAEYISQLERFAKKFEYSEFWNIFLEGKNIFDYAPKAGVNTDFFHAYSHVNSFNSAAYLYWRTGKPEYLKATKAFKNFMDSTQLMATGGYGANREWLLPKNRIVDALLHKNCNFENQCNTYATLRVNRFLAAATGELRYGATSELLLYNSFLASLETDKEGHAFYYSDYGVMGANKWRHPISWTCCSGSRPLAAMELIRNIYFRDEEDALYINLFLASRIGCGKADISLEGDYAKDGVVRIRCTPKTGAKGTQRVYLRKPAYITREPVVSGADVTIQQDRCCITFDLEKEQLAVLSFELPLYSQDILAEQEGVRAFLYGPLVLCAEGKERKPVPALSEFEAMGDGSFRTKQDVFRPFRDFQEDEGYRMYFALEDEQ